MAQGGSAKAAESLASCRHVAQRNQQLKRPVEVASAPAAALGRAPTGAVGRQRGDVDGAKASIQTRGIMRAVLGSETNAMAEVKGW